MTPSAKPAPDQRSGTVAILGRPNVGKSTLLNAALQDSLAIVTPTPQTTRDRLLGVVDFRGAQIALIDTPGLHRPRSRLGRIMNATAMDAARGADVVALMVDVPPRASGPITPHPEDVHLLERIRQIDVPVIVAINKIDLVRNKNLLLPLIDAYAKSEDVETVVPISAREDDGVARVLEEIVARLPHRGPAYDEDFLTDRPMRFLAGEYVREQIILATRQEVPHQVAVRIERFDEQGKTAHIHATVVCSRDGQRGILLGPRGERIKAIGIAARERIEGLLERKVNLKLWVQVRPGWHDSPPTLAELGYDSSVLDGVTGS